MQLETALLRAADSMTLDGFATMARDADGVNIRLLEPLTSLLVRTKNSIYHLILEHDTAAIVRGGQFFPSPTSAELCGATMGGSLIKVGWIGVGFCLEFIANGQRIVTTRVRTIVVKPPSGQSRPH